MATLAWLAVVIVGLLSGALGFRTVERVEWRQPICTTASPCRGDATAPVLHVSEVREYVDIDELQLLRISRGNSIKGASRYFPGRWPSHAASGRQPGFYTKVIYSPVVATVVTDECILGVPSCDAPVRVAIRLPAGQDDLYRATEAVTRAFGNAVAGQPVYVAKVLETKDSAARGIIDEVFRPELNGNKKAIASAVYRVVAARRGFVGAKAEEVQPIVDDKNNTTAAKHEKHEALGAVVDKFQENEDRVVAAAKHQFAQGIVEQEQDKKMAEAASEAAVNEKHETIQSIVDQAKETLSNLSIQGVVEASKRKLNDFVEAVENAKLDHAGEKQSFVQSVAENKISAIKAMSEKKQEFIGTASLIVPLMVSQIKQALGRDSQFDDRSDNGHDFVFADQDQKSAVGEKPNVAVTSVEESVRPVVLKQPAESTIIPEVVTSNDSVKSEESQMSSATEKVISLTESHVLSTSEATRARVSEEQEAVAASSGHQDNSQAVVAKEYARQRRLILGY